METNPRQHTIECPACGNAVEPSDRFCGFCGAELAAAPRQAWETAPAPFTLPRDESYLIPTQRVLLMTFISHGLYFFYWSYLTWKQYRDYTGDIAYPVWHALCLLVPIYNLFRIYAHMRTYRDLMGVAGLPTTIGAGMAVALIVLSSLLDLTGAYLNGGITGTMPVAGWAPMAAFALSLVSLAVLAGLLSHVQGNLNHYWENANGGPLPAARIGTGEVIFALIGVLAWIIIVATLLGILAPEPATP